MIMFKPTRSTIAFWSALIFFVIIAVVTARVPFSLPLVFKIPVFTFPALTSSNSNPGGPLVIQRVITQEQAVEEVVSKSALSVISVVTKQVYLDLFRGPVSEQASIGTGIIIEGDGLILTNKHVVADTTATYTIVLADERSYEVKKIARDPLNDLAILKIDAGGLPTLPLGDSAKVKVGQSVVAIGNALGRFSNTVTTGVISGIGRGIMAGDSSGQTENLDNVFQTDAALNPGNSGGPLLNLAGEVIAVNSAISTGAQNIGFAIPINVAKKTVDSYKKLGKISRPFLGVSYQMISSDMSSLRRLPVGAFIEGVLNGSPAEKAGLQSGDIISKVAGQTLTRDSTLVQILQNHNIGDSVVLTIDRGGKEITVPVVLGEASEQN